MNTIGAISGMQAAELSSKISTAVMRKGLDVAEQQGEAVVSLIEDAAALSGPSASRIDGSPLGARIDVRG